VRLFAFVDFQLFFDKKVKNQYFSENTSFLAYTVFTVFTTVFMVKKWVHPKKGVLKFDFWAFSQKFKYIFWHFLTLTYSAIE